ncbi:hypothetical protein BDR03DRAFT_930574 [Suillus americanus]|nr:hypothetical protein BDR03DRAFT_930574 [Suillus americanus]
MGVDVSTFNHLLSAGFMTIWNTTPIPRDDIPTTAVPRAHHHSLDSAGALGLVLHWLNSTMQGVSLMQIFALIPSTVSHYLNFALAILLRTLKHIPEGIIQWPAGDKFQELNYLVTARHPLLTGSWHDSCIAQLIYKKLRKETPAGYYLVADTAFPCGTDQIAGRIKAPIKAVQHLPSDKIERENLLAFNWQLLSFCQTAEWGMRTLQDLVEACVRLNNLHAQKVSISQICSVYMPIWVQNEQEEVWAHFESMLFSKQHRNDRVA